MRSSLMLLALILNACVGQRPDATTADGAEGSANVEEPDSTRDAADPGTKLEQCERLGALLETTETGTSIVNVNDRSKMDELAEKRRAAADEATALPLGDASLVTLRERYVELCKRMAGALEGVASPDADARSAAVKQHAALDADVATLVDDLNAACAD
ncbi:MAG: hypothetical protein RIF41_22495 [Polyangiaceae bacterium]